MLSLSVAFDEDFEAELAENRDSRIEVSFLGKSPDSELTEVSYQAGQLLSIPINSWLFHLINLLHYDGSWFDT